MWQVEPRLYWRVKIDNKWTWRPATVTGWTPGQVCYTVLPILPQDVVE